MYLKYQVNLAEVSLMSSLLIIPNFEHVSFYKLTLNEEIVRL